VSARAREQNMTQGELSRLIMVMADPLLQSEIASMYASLSRVQLDRDGPAGQDPFRNGSVERLFNDPFFTPEAPDACSGCEQELIDALDCAKRPEFHRTGGSLKSRWTSMRSRYSVAYQRFTSSGQSAHDNFPSFVERGDVLTMFFHCAFLGHPSLRTVLRCIPPEFSREEGAPSIVERDERSQTPGKAANASARDENPGAELPESSSRKRRRNRNVESDGLRSIEDAISAPVQIKLDMGNAAPPADAELSRVRTKKEKLEFLMSLMKAEADVRSAMRTAAGPFLSSLQINLTYIHSQIEETTGIRSSPGETGDGEPTL
jgi:hypothetical protein